MRLQKRTIYISLIMCFISMIYSISVEWQWDFFAFSPERLTFFNNISLGIFASAFLMLSIGTMTYLYESHKTIYELKSLFALALHHSYNINSFDEFNIKLQEIQLLHAKNSPLDFCPILPTKKNKHVLEMQKYVQQIREFYIVQEALPDNEKHIKFNERFDEWYAKFQELDVFFELGILPAK